MSNEMSYTDEQGQEVMTSHYLKSRKSCCKSGCLHCPYGYTVKKYGLNFRRYNKDVDQDLKDSLEYDDELTSEIILLKEKVVGVMQVNKIQIKKLFIKDQFKEQDLYKELIEAYYF